MLVSSTAEKYSIKFNTYSRESLKAFRKLELEGNFFSLIKEIYQNLRVNITVYSDM